MERRRVSQNRFQKIEIEKEIPIPSFSRSKYPFEQMQVGDSFFAPVQSLSSSIMIAQSKTKFRFKSKFQDGGTRVWRVA